MSIEHETKILDIDPGATEARILSLGGYRVGTFSMRRYVYDITPGDRSKWLRLRDTGTETTLAVKHITSDAIDGTDEIETAVGDLDTTHDLLAELGYTPKSYQENTRTTFTLDGAELDIDTWPRIPPYLEIEADSVVTVRGVIARLGYSEEHLTSENTIEVYARYNIDLTAVAELRFPP